MQNDTKNLPYLLLVPELETKGVVPDGILLVVEVWTG
jgi:hypothetical protein